MSTVRIQTDATERIQVTVLDGSLDPITGKTDILLSIMRVSDGWSYDFNDDTFKNAGWTTRREAMTEVSASLAPGDYRYDFDTSAITNRTADDTYMIYVEQSPGTDAKNMPQTGEIKEGQWPDRLDAGVSSRAVAGDEMNLAADAITASRYDETTAYPLAQADTGASAVARTGADGDTLKTLSEQLDPVALEANVGGHVTTALNAYDPPTRTEATADKNEIIVEVDANETKIDALQLDVTSVKGTVDANLDATVSSRATPAQVKAQADQALVDYDAATGADVTTSEGNIRGADGDDLKDLSDQIDGVSTFDPATDEVDIGKVKGVGVVGVDDFKADVAALALEANVQGHAAAALTAHPVSTRPEDIADRDQIIAEVDANEVKIDGVPAAVDVVLTAAHGAGAWNTATPISQQQIRDAMKLAPTAGAPAAGSVDEHLDDIFASGEIVRQVESGRWKIVSNQMIFYADNGTTPLLTFNLFDDAGNPTMVDVMERVLVP